MKKFIEYTYEQIKKEYAEIEKNLDLGKIEDYSDSEAEQSLRYDLNHAKNKFIEFCETATDLQEIKDCAELLKKIENFIYNRFSLND